MRPASFDANILPGSELLPSGSIHHLLFVSIDLAGVLWNEFRSLPYDALRNLGVVMYYDEHFYFASCNEGGERQFDVS